MLLYIRVDESTARLSRFAGRSEILSLSLTIIRYVRRRSETTREKRICVRCKEKWIDYNLKGAVQCACVCVDDEICGIVRRFFSSTRARENLSSGRFCSLFVYCASFGGSFRFCNAAASGQRSPSFATADTRRRVAQVLLRVWFSIEPTVVAI